MVVKICIWKNVLRNFQMSEQYWGCLDKMSEVNFSLAETLSKSRANIYVRKNILNDILALDVVMQNKYRTLIYNNYFYQLLFVFDWPPLQCFCPMTVVSISDIFVKWRSKGLKKTSFDRSMIKLWEPLVWIIFLWNKFVLNRDKICAVSDAIQVNNSLPGWGKA